MAEVIVRRRTLVVADKMRLANFLWKSVPWKELVLDGDMSGEAFAYDKTEPYYLLVIIKEGRVVAFITEDDPYRVILQDEDLENPFNVILKEFNSENQVLIEIQK